MLAFFCIHFSIHFLLIYKFNVLQRDLGCIFIFLGCDCCATNLLGFNISMLIFFLTFAVVVFRFCFCLFSIKTLWNSCAAAWVCERLLAVFAVVSVKCWHICERASDLRRTRARYVHRRRYMSQQRQWQQHQQLQPYYIFIFVSFLFLIIYSKIPHTLVSLENKANRIN